jgi:hypothetical protein
MSRFHKTERNTYQKYINIGDICYHIEIPIDIWDTTPHRRITDHIQYWKKNTHTKFKYGTTTIVDSIPTQATNTCTVCNKTYKTRAGLTKHIKSHHQPSQLVETTPSTEPPSTTITTQNITNNNNITNNIQNNITIRPFGKENPKWIHPRGNHESRQGKAF